MNLNKDQVALNLGGLGGRYALKRENMSSSRRRLVVVLGDRTDLRGCPFCTSLPRRA